MAYTDLTYLKTITDGEPQIIRELVELFISQVPEFIENMKKYYEAGQYIELGKEAHKAKSSIQVMGMSDLEKEMKALQLKTIAGTDVESYAEHIDHFVVQCTAAVEELKAELAAL